MAVDLMSFRCSLLLAPPANGRKAVPMSGRSISLDVPFGRAGADFALTWLAGVGPARVSPKRRRREI
jgi:hypothetical protein